MRRDKKTKEEECKILSKRNCQLNEFPTIKLHVLQKIQEIDLSHNHIKDFNTMVPHGKTSQFALKYLRKINIAYNNICEVSLLVPLASAASNLEEINISRNGLTGRLNFLF